MHITLCVDALQPQLSGIGRYTWELCSGLAAQDEISSLRFYREHALIDDPARLLTASHPRSKWERRPLRRLGRWRSERALRSSIVHGPNYFLPLGADRGVVTVHDLSVFRYPETHPASRVKAFERLFASSVARASHVITDSETIRRELIGTLSLAADAVSAVPLGVSSSFHARGEAEVAAALSRFRLVAGKYGLSVAAFEPRKKIEQLIAAWRRLPSALRQQYPLALAGAAGWHNERLHDEILSAVSEGWLKYLGFVDEQVLPDLYAGARLFVYPSVYEGFGLPPLEAMASGTPAIVANRSCLPEVCGDAARFIDPDDPDGLTLAIEQGLSDEQWRATMVARGLERARLYTWNRCVRDTVAVYQKV